MIRHFKFHTFLVSSWHMLQCRRSATGLYNNWGSQLSRSGPCEELIEVMLLRSGSCKELVEVIRFYGLDPVKNWYRWVGSVSLPQAFSLVSSCLMASSTTCFCSRVKGSAGRLALVLCSRWNCPVKTVLTVSLLLPSRAGDIENRWFVYYCRSRASLCMNCLVLPLTATWKVLINSILLPTLGRVVLVYGGQIQIPWLGDKTDSGMGLPNAHGKCVGVDSGVDIRWGYSTE
jgi:hypothetical protein